MTSLINALNISKSHGQDQLFTDISLSIFAHERLGLIGPNGSGKSTLLKILAGTIEPDSGKVIKNHSVHIVTLAQEDLFRNEDEIGQLLLNSLPHPLDETALQHLIWQITGENLFEDLKQKISTLSGGWRKRLAIVQALIQKPNLLLMDEPTNHLDLSGILWLEKILKDAQFAFVVVTHDRCFLENTTNTIIELNRQFLSGTFKSVGNYQQFLENRTLFLENQQKQEQTLANKLRREQEWLQRGAKARTSKAKYRIDQAEQLKSDLQRMSDSNQANKSVAIDFSATNRKTKILLEAKQINVSRNGKLIIHNLNLTLSPGTCLGILGKNGAGKSTLLKILSGDLMVDSGSIERAANLRIVIFDQLREKLNKDQTLQQALAPHGDSVFYQGKNIHVIAWAKKFLFSAEQLRQSVDKLSGGEQARVLIANLMLESADILLLDEPTNDLDIGTLEILESNLQDFPGAIVLITHDRFLLNRLSSRLLYLDGSGQVQFFADYNQWQKTTENNRASKLLENSANDTKGKKLNYAEQRELKKMDEKIQKAEAELQSLQDQLNNPEIGADLDKLNELCSQIQEVNEKIEKLYQRWEELENALLSCQRRLASREKNPDLELEDNI